MLPEVVIAGAPKCGTSSFFRWLTEHPEMCPARVKETFYLMDPGHPLIRPEANYHRDGLEGYEEFFASCGREGQRAAEATTHYYYQATAREVLSALKPTPHIIFLLRRPADRIYSSFIYTRNNLAALRPGATFRDFLEMGESASDSIISDRRSKASLAIWEREVELSRYVVHLRPWTDSFPSDRIHIYLFEDLRRDPRRFMRKAATDLGLEPAFYESYQFARRNESYGVVSPLLQRTARRWAKRIPSQWLRGRLRNGYLRVLTRSKEEPSAQDIELLCQLDAEFAPSNVALTEEFGLDLSPWQTMRQGTAVQLK